MSVDHAGSPSSGSFTPAPHFGRIHSHAAALAAPRGDRPSWRPQAALAALHRPALVAGLLQRVLAAVRDPVQHLVVGGLPALYVVGVALLVHEPDGCLRGSMWTPAGGGLAFVPIPPSDLTVYPCPAGTHWLRAIVNLFGAELLEHLRAETPARVTEAEIVESLAGYLGELLAWLRRHLRRHADLRAMRRKVSRALLLDPAIVELARHVHRDVVHRDAEVCAASWNIAIRHRAGMLVVRRELPQALPLYGALLASDVLPAHGADDAVAEMRRHLLNEGLSPATWRLLTRSSARLLLAVRQAYGGPLGQAMINHLRMLQALRLSSEPPADAVHSILGRHGGPDRRWPEYVTPLSGASSVPLGHAVRRYSEMRDRTPAGERTSLAAAMHDVIGWISEVRPNLTKNQRRAGWSWLVEQAGRWRVIRLAEQSHGKPSWPVAEPRVDGDYRLSMIGSFVDLMEEGLAMHHCAFERRFECAMGREIVVSIRRRGDDRRVATARYERDHRAVTEPFEGRSPRWKLEQVRSILNQDPPASAARAALRGEGWLNEWSNTSSPRPRMTDEDVLPDVEPQIDAELGDGAEIAPRGQVQRGGRGTFGRQSVRRLVWFSLEGVRTLVSDEFVEPTRNADVFGSVRVEALRSPSELLALADRLGPAARVLGEVVAHDSDAMRNLLRDESLGRRRRTRLAAALEAIDEGEPEYALKEWLEVGGEPALAACRKAIVEWLEQAPDGDDWELFDSEAASAQGAAKDWFERLDHDELHALGVQIIEGDHPGSSYYAAELCGSVEQANAAARRLGLTCRFR